jgi:hypothetical protein
MVLSEQISKGVGRYFEVEKIDGKNQIKINCNDYNSIQYLIFVIYPVKIPAFKIPST